MASIGLVDFGRIVHELAAAAEAFDGFDLRPAGGTRHDGDEGQPQQMGEIGLADSRRP